MAALIAERRTEVLNRRCQLNKKLTFSYAVTPTKTDIAQAQPQPNKSQHRQPVLPNHVWHFNHNEGATGT
ncbi:hypothetical protein AYO50_00355 [Acidobacteria bacterium SCGC AG-212-P17]|nr:hypothetical protein AYO50_00355 [Acidobacteria bacterium SCGC AG-212-P17]